MISVIIPHHRETEQEVSGLFSSLNTQTGVDFNNFEFIVVNDDPDCVLNFDNYINLKDRIYQFTNPKMGWPGISRQIGIDNCHGDYITFCDCDDQLYSPLIFLDMLQRIKSGADVYNYKFIQECLLNFADGTSGFRYVPESNTITWVFAKLIKRQYLIDNDIRFADDIQWHEDTYFNLILFMRNPVSEIVDVPAYLWKYNLKSVTRQNEFEYRFSELPSLINAVDRSMDYAVKYNLQYNAGELVSAITIQYMYCNCVEPARKKYQKNIEKRLSQLIHKWDLMELIFADDMKGYIEQTISNGAGPIIWVPEEGFKHFIERIYKKYE